MSSTSREFADKTDTFLKYVEDMYLKGDFDDGGPMKAKLGTKGSSVDKETAHMGFDALFGSEKE